MQTDNRPRHPSANGLLLVVMLLAAPETAALADPPGVITGTVGRSGDGVTAATAVERKSGRRLAGKVDPATGRFTIGGLALDFAYDCILDFGPARLEGVDFRVPRSDYEEEQPLLPDDVKTITGKVRSMNQFENVVEILAVEGNIQHAVVLLNKLRTTAFYASKPGEIVWRAELWRFERPDETWVKVQDELFTIYYRERIPEEAYKKKSITFDPSLGGIRLATERPVYDLGDVMRPTAEPGIRLRAAKPNKPEAGK